jgi:arylformamidase
MMILEWRQMILPALPYSSCRNPSTLSPIKKGGWLMRIVIGLVISAAAIATTLAVAAPERLTRECRREVIKLCGLNRGDYPACIMKRQSEMSADCRSALRERVLGQRLGESRPEAAPPVAGIPPREMAYGSDPLQRLDFYAGPKGAQPPPLVVNVHGGGWKQGDKGNATGQSKAPHFFTQGYAFASINYRLVPAATLEMQAADVASALAWLKSNAARLGFDGNRIVLTGHSAGAHLVALVGTDPRYLRAAGIDFGDLRGVLPNDGAAYDVAAQMTDGPKMMHKTYAQAFGSDLARQRALSPTLHAGAPNAPAFLLINVQREDGIRQANALAAALRKEGTAVQVNDFPGEGLKGHMEINRKLGEADYPATPVVDAWLKRVFR